MKRLLSFLRKFGWLIRFKHTLWKLLGFYRPPALSPTEALVAETLALHSERQHPSIDPTRGLVRGDFQGVAYLMKMRPGSLVECAVLDHGVWEAHIVSTMAGYMDSTRPIMVVDVGANVGATSIPLARKSPNVHFVLFEPHPAVFRELSDNCSINGLKNVKLVNAAISDSSEVELEFFAQRQHVNMGLSSLRLNFDIGACDVLKVRNLGLDAYLHDRHLPLAVLKIDTQGGELSVLRSGVETIKKDRPVIFFEFESEYFPDPKEEEGVRLEIIRFFGEIGYQIYSLAPGMKYLPMVTLAGYHHGDLLAVPLATS